MQLREESPQPYFSLRPLVVILQTNGSFVFSWPKNQRLSQPKFSISLCLWSIFIKLVTIMQLLVTLSVEIPAMPRGTIGEEAFAISLLVFNGANILSVVIYPLCSMKLVKVIEILDNLSGNVTDSSKFFRSITWSFNVKLTVMFLLYLITASGVTNIYITDKSTHWMMKITKIVATLTSIMDVIVWQFLFHFILGILGEHTIKKTTEFSQRIKSMTLGNRSYFISCDNLNSKNGKTDETSMHFALRLEQHIRKVS